MLALLPQPCGVPKTAAGPGSEFYVQVKRGCSSQKGLGQDVSLPLVCVWSPQELNDLASLSDLGHYRYKPSGADPS